MKSTSKAALWFGYGVVAMAVAGAIASCTTVQLAKAKDILATCGGPAEQAAKAQVISIVTDIVEQNSENWSEQLAALEKTAEAGVLCALQQIADPAQPTVRTMTRAVPATPERLIGIGNAQKYLSQHN